MSSQAAEWNEGPAKSSAALDGRERGTVQLADGAYDGVEGLGRGRSVVAARRGDPQAPLPRPVVEAGLGHLGGEADDVAQVELLGHALEVGEQVGLGREARAPCIGLGEGEAVELVGHVDPAARVHVLEPGAPDVRVLLEHRDLDPGLAQPVRRGQTRGTGADDRTPEASSAVGDLDLVDVPGRGPGIALEGQLLEQEALPLLGRTRTDEEGEGPPELVGGEPVARPAGRRVGHQGLDGELTGRGLLLGLQAAGGGDELGLVRGQVGSQQVQVAGQAGHGAEERVHVGAGHGRFGPRPADRCAVVPRCVPPLPCAAA